MARVRSRWNRLWQRELARYPENYMRYFHLALAILVTIVLYYELYTVGGVSPLLAVQLHMSFVFLVVMIGVTNLLGAFGSLAAGLADRLGRANIVVWGLFVVGILTALVVPATTSRWALAAALCAIGFVEGMLLVATPALVRDFSPQTGRATAMGLWNCGPVAGSLVVAIVAAATLEYFGNSWTSQFRISGIVGLVTFALALIAMRELAPPLRDQLIVRSQEGALAEQRAAAGLDVKLDKPFTQLLQLDVVGTAVGSGLLLLLYFTLVGFGPILYATAFHFNASQANAIAAWAWGANVVVSVLAGFLFDWTGLRKPWMMLGGLLTVIFELVLLFNLGNPLSFVALAAITACMSGSFGIAIVAFYAGYTETIEAHNPALVATGLAIWGWTIRVIAFISFLVIPAVVTSATTLLKGHIRSPQFAAALTAVYGEWKVWMWVCVVGAIAFMFTVPLHCGPWTRKQAKSRMREHDSRIAAELASLRRPSHRG